MRTIASPIALTDRITTLDVLRGLAIFGILMVNMQLFHQPMLVMMMGYTGSASTADLLSELVIKIFFEGKFYVLFSMLFGYGFYIFLNKQPIEGNSMVPVFRRRVFFLLLFGILHVVFLWPGDILIFYALFGFVLLLFRKVSDRGLIKWAIWLSLIPVILTTLFAALFTLASMVPEAATEMDQGIQENLAATQKLFEDMQQAYSTGSFTEIMAARVKEWLTMLPGVLFFYPMVLAMFLLGVWSARKGLLKNQEAHLPFFRKALIWGLSIGLPTSVLYAISYMLAQRQVPDFYTALSTLGHIYGGFFFSLAYVSAIVLLTNNNRLRSFSRWLSPAGRMALTNYLLHSIICTTIFLPYGFGLFGQITHWQGILLTIAIFAAQIPFSNWWLSKFRYGPFEWLWRSLTYLKWQPLRIKKA